MVFSHGEDPEVYRYFSGEGVGFLTPGSLIRLRLHPELGRKWDIHIENGFCSIYPEDDPGLVQLLDLLFERGELDELVIRHAGFDEENPGVEIPEFPA